VKAVGRSSRGRPILLGGRFSSFRCAAGTRFWRFTSDASQGLSPAAISSLGIREMAAAIEIQVAIEPPNKGADTLLNIKFRRIGTPNMDVFTKWEFCFVSSLFYNGRDGLDFRPNLETD
jgi:hypothetical protein